MDCFELFYKKIWQKKRVINQRNTQGVRLINVSEDEKLIGIAKVEDVG